MVLKLAFALLGVLLYLRITPGEFHDGTRSSGNRGTLSYNQRDYYRHDAEYIPINVCHRASLPCPTL